MPLSFDHSFELVNPDRRSRFLIICDHASNALPDEYGTLGLDAADFEKHIAWDIGAAHITRQLADRLDCPAVLSGFSRLLIDPNRGHDDPTLVMKLSDGNIIPGNRDTDPYRDAAAWQRRIDRFHAPYHQAITDRIEQALADSQDAGKVPIILSVHSFTPVWRGRQRPWEAAVLWDKDDRLPGHLFAALAKLPIVIGDNVPYSGQLKNDCLYRHGTRRGLPHALIELRQDLLGNPADCDRWLSVLSEAMHHAAEDSACDAHRHYGSHTD